MAVPQSALSTTKRAWKEMKEHEVQGAPAKKIKEWRAVTAQANKEIVKLQRELEATRQRATVERDILAEEMRSELVSREANAVRTADRYSAFSDRLDDDSATAKGVYQRAVRAAASIEASLAGLCTHALNVGSGTAKLVERTRQTEGGALDV